MVMFVDFGELFLVVGSEAGEMPAQAIGSFDQVITQISVSGLGQATFFRLKISRGKTWPPQAGELGDGILGIAQVLGAVNLALAVPLHAAEKAIQTAQFGGNAAGEDQANARDGTQQGHLGVVSLGIGGDPLFHLLDLVFKKLDMVHHQIQDMLNWFS